jgi:hypothetical protein
MTNNRNSTRWYSSKQEKQVAKIVNGKCQSNSGATLFSKGDIKSSNWLYECKTCIKEQESFSIKKEWLDKLKQEAFAMNKEYFSLVFNFGDIKNSENFYILNEKVFKQIITLLDELEN